MPDPFPITIWRDSVCAGDDADAPHAWTLDAPRNMTLRDFIDACLERRYLASINGGKATWILEASRPLVVIAQQWTGPRFLVEPDSPILSLIDAASSPHLNFRYRTQTDPDEVFAVLSRAKPMLAS